MSTNLFVRVNKSEVLLFHVFTNIVELSEQTIGLDTM